MWYSQVPTYPTVPLHTILATFWTHDIMIWHLKCLKAPGRGQLHLSTCPPGAGAAVLLCGGAAALAGAGGGAPLLRTPRGQLLLTSRPPGAGAAVLPRRARRPPGGRSSRPLRSPAPASLRLQPAPPASRACFVVKTHANSIDLAFSTGAASKSDNLKGDPWQFLHGIVELDKSFPSHVSVAKIHADSMCRSRPKFTNFRDLTPWPHECRESTAPSRGSIPLTS